MLREIKTFMFDGIDKKDIDKFYCVLLGAYMTNELVEFLRNKYKILENIKEDDIKRIWPYEVKPNNKIEIILDILVDIT